MRRTTVVLAALCGVLSAVALGNGTAANASTPPEAPCVLPADGEHSITVDGVERSYRTIAPSTAGGAGGPVPVVVAVHGWSGSAAQFTEVTGLGEQGPAAGVLVVLPQGVGDPAGWEIPNWASDGEYLDAVLADVAATGCVDPHRMWIGGHSAGSAFSAFYACARPGTFAGVVLDSAITPTLCNESTPNVYVLFGTADPAVPYEGGDFNGFELEPTTVVVGRWADRAGCTVGPVGRGVGDDVLALEWSGCLSDRVVRLYSVVGGGHVWFTGDAASIDATCLLLTGADADPGGNPDLSGCES